MKFLQFLFARLREPSTMAGLSIIGAMVGMPPGSMDLVVQIAVGVTGLAAIALPEVSAQ